MPDTGPLNKTGRIVWGFLLIIAGVGAVLLAVKGEIVSIAAMAAEEKVAPLRTQLDIIKTQREEDKERLEAAGRNIYRICLKDQIRECEQ